MRTRAEHGAVTAEAAVVLPVLVLVTAGLAWIVALGIAQVRVVDAARETARALARGDDPGASEASGRRVAPDGARFEVTRSEAEVRVRVVATVHGPGGLLGLPDFEAESTAVAQVER